MLSWLCSLEHEDCVANSRSLFEAWMKNPANKSIDVNLQQIVYQTAIRNGGVKEREFLRNKIGKEGNDLEKERMSTALAALELTEDKNLLNQNSNNALTNSLPRVYQTLTSNNLENKNAFQRLNQKFLVRAGVETLFEIEVQEMVSEWLRRYGE